MTQKKMVENICRVFDAASPQERISGMGWYMRAHIEAEALTSKYYLTTTQVVGVIAALSPGREWEKNKYDAETLIHDFKRLHLRGADLPMVGSYGRKNVLKAERILMGDRPHEVLGGPKVTAFYECLINPWRDDGVVCVDRHAKSVAIGRRVLDKEATVTVRQYRAISEAYRVAAKRHGIRAHEIHAITWVAWRNLIAKGSEV